MAKDAPPDITITLSPTQVDEVLRAAAQSQAPSVSALISGGIASGAAPAGLLPTDATDPRLSHSMLRGLSLLTCFSASGEPRGLNEMARELNMSPSTAHRYALTLVHIGLLERSPESRKYSLPASQAH